MKNNGPVFRLKNGNYKIDLATDHRKLLTQLVEQLRDSLATTTDDANLRRLFPTAYNNDAKKDAEYQRLMRDELIASRLDSIATVDAFLGDDKLKIISFSQLDAFCAALNSVRLVLGTLLNVGEIDDDLDEDDPRHDELALYNFLSWLLDGAISALMANPLP